MTDQGKYDFLESMGGDATKEQRERWLLLREGKASLFAETMAWVGVWRGQGGESESRLRDRLELWLEACLREGVIQDAAQQASLRASLLLMLAEKSAPTASAILADTAVVQETATMSDLAAVVRETVAASDAAAASIVRPVLEVSEAVVFPTIPYEEEIPSSPTTQPWAALASVSAEAAEVSVSAEAAEVSVSAQTAEVSVALPPSVAPVVVSSLYAPPKQVQTEASDPSKASEAREATESFNARAGVGSADMSRGRGRSRRGGVSASEGEGPSLSDALPEGSMDAADLTDLPDLSWEDARTKEDRAVMEASSWARVLQPFLAQNWLYFLGTFLILASGFYLLSLAWEGMSTLGRQAVIWGSLATGSVAFSGLGVLLKRRAELQVAGRSFGVVSLGLLGIAGMAAGPLWSLSVPAAGGVMAGTLGLLVWGLRWLRAMDAGPTTKLATISSVVLLSGVIFVPWFGHLGHIWGVVGVLSLGTLFFWSVARVWGALRFGRLNWSDVFCFWRMQRGIERVDTREVQGEQTPLTVQELLFFFAPQAYLWLLLVGWSGWSLGGSLLLALPYVAPLCVVLGFVLVEIGEWVRFIPKDGHTLQRKTLGGEAQGEEGEGFFVWFWLGALFGVVGIVQAWGALGSLVLGAGALGVLFSRGADVRARWSLEALSALSGVVAYVASLGMWFAPADLSARWMVEVWSVPMQAWWMLPASVLLIAVGRRVRDLRAMRGQVWPLLGALLALYGVGVLLVSDVLGRGGVSLGMLLAMPLYALGFLYVGELREKKSWSRLGLVLWVYGSAVIGGRVFSWEVFSGGVTDRASWSLLVFVATAVLVWGVGRVLERRSLLPHTRFVLDEALLWLPLVLVFFWAKQPDAVGLLNPWAWHPRAAFVWGMVGLWLYGGFFFWWSYASRSGAMARWTLVWWGGASVLLAISVRRWLGLPLGTGGAALVAMCVSFVLFELGMRWRGGARRRERRLGLPWERAEVLEESETAEDWALWRMPLLEAAHLVWAVGLLQLFRVFSRGIEAQGLALWVLCLGTLFAWQVAWRHQVAVMGFVGFVLSGIAWGAAWGWPYALRADIESVRVWWGFLGIAGGFWAVWSLVLLGVYVWQGEIDEKSRWTGVFRAAIEMLPVFGVIWMVGLGGLTVRAVMMPAGVSLEWLFAGWGGSALLWYAMAWMMRRWLWVWWGASSLLVCWVLPWWSQLAWPSLLVCGLGGVLVLFAFGSWGGWKRKTATKGALLTRGHAWLVVRGEGAQLWGEGHRLYGLAWCLLALPGLWWCWREGWMVGGLAASGLGLSIVPMFWEGWQRADASALSGSRWFGLSLLAAGVGCTVGLFAALPSSWQPQGAWLWCASFGMVSGWVAWLVMLCVGVRDPLSLRLQWGYREWASGWIESLYGWRLAGMPALDIYTQEQFVYSEEDASDTESGTTEETDTESGTTEGIDAESGTAEGIDAESDALVMRHDGAYGVEFARWALLQRKPKTAVGWGWFRLGMISEAVFVWSALLSVVCFGMAWWGDRAASAWLLWIVLPWVASLWLRPRDITVTVVGVMMFWGWWWGAIAGWTVWAVVWGVLLPYGALGASYWREKSLSELRGIVGWSGSLGGLSLGVGVISVLGLVWPSSETRWLGYVGSIAVAVLYQIVMWIARWRGGRLEPLFEMVAWGRASEETERAERWGMVWHQMRALYKAAMMVGGVFAILWLGSSWPNGGGWLLLFFVPTLLDLSQSFQRFSWTWMMVWLSVWGLHWAPYWLQKESWSVWLWSVWALGALWLAAESAVGALWHGVRERGSLRVVWALWHMRGLSASMALFFAACGIFLYGALLAGFVLEPVGYSLGVSVYWLKDARALPWWIWLLVPVLYVGMVLQLRRQSALFWAGCAIFLSPLVMGAAWGAHSWRMLAMEFAVGGWMLLLGALLVWVRSQGERLREQALHGKNAAVPKEGTNTVEGWTPALVYQIYYKDQATEPVWLKELTVFSAGLEGHATHLLERRLLQFLWELPALGTLWLYARNRIAHLAGWMGLLGMGIVVAFSPRSMTLREGALWGLGLLCVGAGVFVRLRPWRSLWALWAAGFGLVGLWGLWFGWYANTPMVAGGFLGMGLVSCVLAAWWLRAARRYWTEDVAGLRRGAVVESFLRSLVCGPMWRPGGLTQDWNWEWSAQTEERGLPLVQKGSRALKWNSFVLLWLAWGVFGIACDRLSPSSPLILHGMAVLLLLMQSWLWVGWALERNRDWMAYVGFAAFLGVYGYLRSVMDIGERGLDAWVFLVVGFVLLGFREVWQRMGGALLQRVAQRISYILPLLALLAGAWGGKTPPVASWLIAGVFYGILAHQYGLRWLAIPALGFLNGGIFLFLGQQEISAVQWYVLPIGLSLFAVSGIFASDLGHKGRHFFRMAGALAIYLTSMVQVLSFRGITDVLLLAGLALAGIIAGIALQIRSFLFLGLGFLVADIAINLFRIGVQDRVIGMIFLFLTGILLLASAVFFNLKREAILARIRNWQSQISSWD